MGGYRQLPITEFNPQQSNPLEMLARVNQLKTAQLQQQGLAQENQQRQLNIASQQAIMKAYSEAGGDLEKTLPIAAKYGAMPADLITLRQAGIEQQQSNIKLLQLKGERAVQEADLAQGAHDTVTAAPAEQKPAVYQEQLQKLGQAGIDTSNLPQQYPGDDQFKFMGIGLKAHTQQLKDLAASADLQKTQAQTQEASSRAHEADVNASRTQQEMQLGTGPMADAKYRFLVQSQKMGRQLSPEENAWKGAYEKQKTLVPATTIQLQGGLLSQQAKDMAANMYEQTGQLPTGMRSPGMSAGILNTAAANNPNANIAANKASYTADADSLKSIQKNLDSVSAFENTANKNLDLFLQQAKKVIDTGSPLINAPLRSISKQMGGADQAAYEAARQVAINEIAKVTGSPGLSGQLTDSARHEVESFNPNSATLAQTYKVASVLKQDMANRHQSYQQQINDIKGRMGGSSQAQPAASGMTRIKASDGSLHDIPSANLSKAKQIDPNLQVVQ